MLRSMTIPPHIADALAMVNIELRAKNLAATAEPLFDGPQIITLLCRTAFGVDPKRIKALSDALAMRTGADACAIQQSGLGLIIQLPKAKEHRRKLLPAHLERIISRERRRKPRSAVPVGLDAEGRAVWVDLADSRSPHLIAVGLTGSGKSNLLLWMAYRLASQNRAEHLQLLAISPKAADVEWFSRLPHLLHPPVSSTFEASRVMAWLMSEVERRNAHMVTRPALVVLLDEAPHLIEADPAIGDGLNRIAQIGRSLGVHLLIGSQRADQKTIGGLIYNMPARAIGRVGSSQFSWVTSGRSNSEADQLLGNGDLLLSSADGLTRFQAPLMVNREWGRLERAAFQRELDLPHPVEFTATATASNATPLEDDQLLAIAERFQEGASIRSVMRDWKIGYDRAKQIQEIVLEEVSIEQ